MNKGKTLVFKSGTFFPENFVFVGIVGAIVGVSLIVTSSTGAGVILLLLSLPLFLIQKGVRLDPVHKTTKEFTGILGIELGKKRSHNQLVKLLLKKEKYRQTMNSRGSSTTLRYEVYNAYLVTDKETILLTRGKNEKRIARKIKSVADRLGLLLEFIE